MAVAANLDACAFGKHLAHSKVETKQIYLQLEASMKSKILLTLSICFLGWAMQACTDFEEGAAIGAIAGGIIGSSNHDRGYGRHYRDCKNCYTYDSRMSLMAYSPTAEAANNEIDSVAQHYNIPVATAQMIISSIHSAQNKDLSGLKNLGLGESDISNFYQNKSMSDKAISNVSQKLGFDQDETKELLSDMSNDVQAEKLARNLQ